MMVGIKHALITTGPAYVISLIFFVVYGLRYGEGTVGGEIYDDIINTVSTDFKLSPLLLIPVLVVIVLIVRKKPTIPTFVAGIAVGAVFAMAVQGMDFATLLTTMYSGYAGESGSATVDSMLNRGGLTSMQGTITLLMAAAMFPFEGRRCFGYFAELHGKNCKNGKNNVSWLYLDPHAFLLHYRCVLCDIPCYRRYGEGYVPEIWA